MSAQIIQLNCGVADRYARLSAIGMRPEDKEEALAEGLAFGQRLVEGALTHARVDQMIANKRERLILQLQEIDRL